MHGNAPLSPLTGVPGWESIPEQHLLLELAQQVPANGVIVEIGGEFGMSASLFFKGAEKSVKIYTVDLFPGDLLSKHRANLAEAGYAERSRQVEGDSRHVVEEWKRAFARDTLEYPRDGQIDLLFIDGDHTYEGVLADLNNWTPFVTSGGVVVLHDVACETNKLPHALHYEVARALAEWNLQQGGAWETTNMIDSMVVLKRVYAPDPAKNSDRSGLTWAAAMPDEDATLSKQAAPAELTPTTDMLDVDDEVHAPVDPEIYDNPTYDEMTHYEPKEKPRRRTRKGKK